MTADTSMSDPTRNAADEPTHRTARLFAVVAVLLLIPGLADLAVLSFQQLYPDLLAGAEYLTPGRLGPAARFFLLNGWAVTGLLGGAMYAVSATTRTSLRRAPLGSASLMLIVVGTFAGAFGIIFGLQSGTVGFEAPLWARAVLVAGWVLAALTISGTSRVAEHDGGPTVWYVTTGAWWLAISGVVSLIPPVDGVAGSIQTAFAEAAIVGLFVIVTSVGLIYHVATALSGTDPATPRPLSALGFWSLAVTWGSMAATGLMFSPAPDWLETFGVAMAIAAIVPLLIIATDLGLMVKGTNADIEDRATIRYAMVTMVSLAALTAVNLLLTWRSTSAVIHHTSAVTGRSLLISAGVATFAIFASQSLLKGGRADGSSLHFAWSTAALVGVIVGTVGGGIAVGFSWASGPASTSFANWGPAWEITAATARPFAWITAASVSMFLVAQIAHLFVVVGPDQVPLARAGGAPDYDLEFEGAVAQPNRNRLIAGAVVVWLFVALFTGVFPMIDPDNRESTILGDEVRNLPAGSLAEDGRAVFVSEGCTECHTQIVRPVGTDVGLGPVSQAGDYLHDSPALLGSVRVGPDLMHVASREGFDPAVVRAHLMDPQAARSWSTMPGYAHLSDEDLDALVAYIETLR